MPRSFKRILLSVSASTLLLSLPAHAVDYNVSAVAGCAAIPFCNNGGTVEPGAILNEDFRLILDDATNVNINQTVTSTNAAAPIFVLDTAGSSDIVFNSAGVSSTGRTLVATNGAQTNARQVTFANGTQTTTGLVVDTSNSGANIVTVIADGGRFAAGNSGILLGDNDVLDLRGSTIASTAETDYDVTSVSGSGVANGSLLFLTQQASDSEISEATMTISNFQQVTTAGSFGTAADHTVSTLTNIGSLNLGDATSGNLILAGAGASDVGIINNSNLLDITANSALTVSTLNLQDDGVLETDSDTVINATNLTMSGTANFGLSTNVSLSGGTNMQIIGNASGQLMSQDITAAGVSDSLSVDGGGTGANDYTLSGDLSGFETIAVTANELALTGTVTGVDDIDITGGAILDLSGIGGAAITVDNAIDVTNGTLNITGTTINGDMNVDVANGTVTGDLVFGAGDNVLTFNGDGTPGVTFANNVNAGGQTAGDSLVVDMDLATDSLALTGNVTGFETVNVTTGVLDISGAASFANDLIAVGENGTLNATGQTLSGDVTLDVNAALTGNLTFDGGDNTLTFNGDGTPGASFANDFNGGGQAAGDDLVVAMDLSTDSLALTGNVTGFETVTINEGELDLSGATSLTVGEIIVNDGGAINSGAFTLTDDVTVNAGGAINGATLNFGAGAQTFAVTNATAGVQTLAGNVADAGGADIISLTAGNAATDLTLSGNLSGFETLNTAGTGTVTLTGAVSDLDDVNVTGGSTLDISGVSGGAIAVTNDIAVDGSVIEVGATTINGDLRMTGASDFAATPNLTVNGDVIFDGNVGGGVTHAENISATNLTANTTGTVELDGAITSVTALTVGSTATLDLDGSINTLTSASIDGTLDVRDLATIEGVMTVNNGGTFQSDNDTLITGTLNANAGSSIATATFGAGDDVFNITGTAAADNVTHTIDMGAGNNQINIDGGGTGANGLIVNGTYSNVDTLTITANDVTANAAFAGVTTLDVSAGATLIAQQGIGATTVNVDGTYDITALAAEGAIINVGATGALETDNDTIINNDVTLAAGGDFGTSTDVTFGVGDNTLSVTGTAGPDSFDENIDGGLGADILTSNGGATAATYTGTIDGFETITIDTGITAFTNTITGTDDITITNGGNLDLSGYVPGSITIANDIDVVNGTLTTDPGLDLDTDLTLHYIDANTSGSLVMGDNGHTVTLTGAAVGAGNSDSTLTGGTGTDAFVVNFNAGGTYTQDEVITDFETLTVTSGTLDMDVATSFDTVSVTDTLDIRDAATFTGATSITVNNNGTLLADNNSIITTPNLTVAAGGGFGASTDVVFDGGATTLSYTGAVGADTVTANLDGGLGTDSLTIDSNGIGSNRLTASGAIAGFETVTIAPGEVRLTGSVADIDTATINGILEITDLASFDATTAINVNATGTLITDVDTVINTATLTVTDGSLGTTTDMLFGAGDNNIVYNSSNVVNANIDAGNGTDGLSLGGGQTLNGAYTGFENLSVLAGTATFGMGSSINALTNTTLNVATGGLDVANLVGFSSTDITLAQDTRLISDADTVITATNLTMTDNADLQGVIQLDTGGGTWSLNSNAVPTTIAGVVDGGDNSWIANLQGTAALIFDGDITDFDTITMTGPNIDVNGVIQDFNTLTLNGTVDVTDAANIGQAGDGTIILNNGATLLTDADTGLFANLTLDDGAGFGASTDVTLLDNGTLAFTGTVPGVQTIAQNITNISDVTMNIAGGEVNFTGTLTDLDSVVITNGILDFDQANLAPDTVTVNGGTLDVVDAGAFGEAVNGTMTLATGTTFLSDGDTVLNFDTITVGEGVSFGATTDLLMGTDATLFDIAGNAGVAETYAFNIDGGAGVDELQVRDNGDVNNSSFFSGNITNVETLDLLGATLGGTVDTGAGDDTIILNASHVTGSLTSGAGTDSVTWDGTSTITGSFDGGAGGDAITIAGGDMTVDGVLSNINSLTYGAAATVTYDNAAILATTVDGGAGAAILNVRQAGIDGAINMGADNDVLGQIGTAGNTSFSSAIDMGTGDDTITVNGATQATTIAFNDTITFDGAGTDALNLTQGTITLNQVVGAAGANDAALDIGDNTVVTIRDTVQASTFNQESNQGLTFYLFDDSTHGQLVLSGNALANDTTLGADADEAQISLNIDPTHSLDDGDIITLITDAGGGDLINQFTLDGTNNTLFLNFNENTAAVAGTYSIAVDVNQASTVLAQSEGDVSNGLQNSINAAEAMIDLNGSTDEFAQIRTTLLNSETSEAAAAVADTLVSNVSTGTVESTIQVGDTVRDLTSRRIDYRRTGQRNQGVSSGEFDNDRTYLSQGTRVWGQGFGAYAEQDTRDGFAGYDATTYGTAVGIDTTDMYDNGMIGAAFSYANTSVESDNSNSTETDIDSYQVTLYGGFDVAPDTYINAMASYTYSQNEHVRRNVGGNPALTARADYEGQQGAARLEIGHRFNVSDNVMFTPSFAADYTHGRLDAYSETGAGNAGLRVETDNYQQLDVGVDMALSYAAQLDSGTVFEPRFNVGYSYAAISDPVKTTSNFIAGGSAFTTEGLEPSEHTIHLGLGAAIYTVDGWEVSANIDVDLADEYVEGAGTVRAAKAFK